MFRILIFVLEILLLDAYQIMFALNCGTYTHTVVNTKFFNYTVDSFFQGVASVAQIKQQLPQSIINQADRQLIKSHRTTAPGYTIFSYHPVLPQQNHYIVLMTMIQTEYKSKGERVFQIKLGQQIVHTVDIFAEVGNGKILHKWIQLDVKQQMVFLNGTLPALNAFNFNTNQLKIVFEGIKNKPKIQSLMLMKGIDSIYLLKQFLQSEQQKSVKVKQYLAQKYRKQPKLSYRPLLSTDIIPPPDSEIKKIINKFFNLRSVGSIICGIIAVHFEKIIGFINSKLNLITGKLKFMKKSETKKKD